MKQTTATEKVIGNNRFYIRPFAAFTAANISGDLAAMLTPLLGAAASLLGSGKKSSNFMDADIDDALPAFTQSMSTLSGDKFERMMRRLLINYENISVESDVTNGRLQLLDLDTANEIFCGDIQDMYILCWEVIKLNFEGFFKKFGGQFGSLQEVFQKMTPTSENTESLT